MRHLPIALKFNFITCKMELTLFTCVKLIAQCLGSWCAYSEYKELSRSWLPDSRPGLLPMILHFLY